MKFILYILLASSALFSLNVQHISVDGITRDYYVHVPSTYKKNTPVPLIIFLHGGGMMTLRLGCELSNTFSAIAPAIANMPTNYLCTPKNPLSILLMNGTKDPIMPWSGGHVKFWKKTMGEVHSTQESINFWRDHNHCKKTATVHHLPNINTQDKSTVKVSRFGECQNNTLVELYTIEGGGHTLPSKKGFNFPHLVGEKNRDIEGIGVIVEFLLKASPKQ